MNLFIALLVGCGCGAGASQGLDGATPDSPAPPDSGPQWDTGPCTYGALDGGAPPATHRPVLSYDQYLDFDPSISGGDSPQAVFVDQDGIAVFGSRNTLRATFDGAFVSRSPNPTDNCYLFVQGPESYGATCSGATGKQFCIIDRSGQVVNCPRVDPPGTQIEVVGWDGSSFALSYRSADETQYSLITYDSSGAFVAERSLALPPHTSGSKAFVGDMLQIMAVMPRQGTPESCISQQLVVFSGSFDESARRIWDLLPGDFIESQSGVVATNGQRTLLIYYAQCSQHEPGMPEDFSSCNGTWPPNPPRATLFTIVGEDGAPLEPLRRRAPTGLSNARAHWDGQRFLVLAQGAGWPSEPTLHAFDVDGNITATSSVLPLGGGTHAVVLAPVGDNDYVAAYKVLNGEIWITRLSLLPL